MAKTISSLSVSLNSNVAPFQNGLKSSSRSVTEFVSKTESAGASLLELSGVGAAVGAAFEIASKAVEAFGDAFKNAAQFETASVQLKALTGSSDVAASSLDNLRKMSEHTPFSFPDLLTAEKRLLAVGVSAQAIPTILKQSGDVAAGVGASIGDISDAFVRVASEGSLGTRELKEFGREGIPLLQTLARQFGTSAEGVKQLAENGQIGFTQLEEAFASMTGAGGRFNGILEAQANTIGGVWHTITATIEDDGAKIAEAVIKAFHIDKAFSGSTSIVDKITDKVIHLIDIAGHVADVIYRAFNGSELQKFIIYMGQIDMKIINLEGSTLVSLAKTLYKAFDGSALQGFIIGLAQIDEKMYELAGTTAFKVMEYGLNIIEKLAKAVIGLGEYFYKAFNIAPLLAKAEAAIHKLGVAINYVLDSLLKLEGVELSKVEPPKIDKPEVPDPDPAKVKTFLDPSSQTLTITPEIKHAKIIRSGSAESQALQYQQPKLLMLNMGTNVAAAHQSLAPEAQQVLPNTKLPAGSRSQSAPSLAEQYQKPDIAIPKIPAKQVKQDKPIKPYEAKHAVVDKHYKELGGYQGVRTQLEDATLKNGLYEMHSNLGGHMSAKLTPEQYDTFRSAGFGQRDYTNYGVDMNDRSSDHYKSTLKEALERNSMGVHDRWVANHGGVQPDSIQKRDLSSLWRKPDSSIDKWNKSHEGGEAGGYLPHPSAARLDAAIKATADAAMSKPNVSKTPAPKVTVPAVSHPHVAAETLTSNAQKTEDNKEDWRQANEWLYRIEYNTRPIQQNQTQTVSI